MICRSVIAAALVVAACGKRAPTFDASILPVWDAAEDARIDPCVPRARACANGDKCTLVDASGSLERACEPATGAKARGDLCTLAAAGDGHDDCADGLDCTALGALQVGARVCQAFCHRPLDCLAQQACAAVDALDPHDGVCLDTCAPFGACPSQMSCAEYLASADLGLPIFACRAAGALGLDAECTRNDDCIADAVCSHPPGSFIFRCMALCDAAHPCATGTCDLAFVNSGVCE